LRGCRGTVAFLAMKKLINLLDSGQLCCYLAQSRLLEYPGVQQEKQLRTGLSAKIVLRAILTGHAPVRKHLHIMGLFDGEPTCRFCRMETETVHHIICCCLALACQHYNFLGKLVAEPKDISMALLKDLCLFIRDTGLMKLC
jgi:hypothetical protein